MFVQLFLGKVRFVFLVTKNMRLILENPGYRKTALFHWIKLPSSSFKWKTAKTKRMVF